MRALLMLCMLCSCCACCAVQVGMAREALLLSEAEELREQLAQAAESAAAAASEAGAEIGALRLVRGWAGGCGCVGGPVWCVPIYVFFATVPLSAPHSRLRLYLVESLL